MTRDELTALVLAKVAERCEEVATRPKPRWPWDVREHEHDLERGPRYSPTWFGELADTEARRVRVLRALYRLGEAGLIEVIKSDGNRLERVRMTPAGLEAVAAMGETAAT